MEKLKEILEHIQKKFFKKKESKEEEIGNYSMNEGKADKVFGFRREVIRLTGVFFAAVLILAFILASSEGESEKKRSRNDAEVDGIGNSGSAKTEKCVAE